MIGEVIDGKYEIIKLIGEGGMGAVYEASKVEDSSRCAVKLIHDEAMAQDDVLIARFQREAKAAQRVVSDHIVGILGAGHDDTTGHPYMVMEMLDGENALELLKRLGPLPPQLALRIGVQTCKGLAKAHRAGVVHRDIKPANLFLARGEGDAITLKLLDFGVAKFKMDQASDTANESLTRTGSMLGSPMYMSPEQARGLKSIDRRADIWSLGVVMYQLLSGRVPLQDVDGLGELIISICSDPPTPVSEHAPWLSKQLDAVIAKALTLSREERYQGADAFGKALEKHLDDKGPKGWKIDASMLVPLDEEARKGTAGEDEVVVKTGDGASADDATVALGSGKQASAAKKASLKPASRAKPAKPPRPPRIVDPETVEPEDVEPADEKSPKPGFTKGKKEDAKKDDAEAKKSDTAKDDANKDDAKKGDAKKGDAKKDDANKDDANKDDANKDDAEKGDAEKDDANKGDAEKGDAEKDDAEKDDAEKDDAEKDDAKKDDAKKDDADEDDEEGRFSEELSVVDDWAASPKEQAEAVEAAAKEQEEDPFEDPIELPERQPNRRLLAVVAGVVVGALLLIAFTMMGGDDETSATAPASSASAPPATATPSVTATTTASAAAPEAEDEGSEEAGDEDAAVAGEGLRVQIVPKHAKVTLNGEEVPVEDGYIQISGEPGSEHVVILKVWGATRMARIRITPDGPKPDRVVFVAPRREDIYE